jgi:flagellin
LNSCESNLTLLKEISMSVINTNVSALRAQDAVRVGNRTLADAMERLSTGSRINSAKDDAAGLSISTRMTSQMRGLSVAIRNANDGISISQTAEGAMSEVNSILQRMRDLSVQSVNSVNSAQDRANMNNEVKALSAEIDRIAGTTTFNNQKILDGSFTGKMLQVGANANETIEMNIANLSATSLGRVNLSSTAMATTGATAKGTPAVETVAQLAFFGNDTYTFKVAGVSVTGAVTNSSPSALVDNINNNLKAAGNTTVTAKLVNGAVELRNSLGGNIGITDFSSASNGKATFTVMSGGGATTLLDDTAAVTSSTGAVGSAASSTGVVLSLANLAGGAGSNGTYSFKVNGVAVSVVGEDTENTVKAKLATALGSSYNVHIGADATSTATAAFLTATNTTGGAALFSAAKTAGTGVNSGGFGLAAGEFIITSATNNVPINITEFQATDGVAAGVKGTIRAVGGGSEAVLVDNTNSFTVAEKYNFPSELSLNFSSTTSDYVVTLDGASFTVTAANLAAGTAATKLITDINTIANATTMNTTAQTGSTLNGKVAAGSLGSLGNAVVAGTSDKSGATKINYEIVQNGSTLSIKKAGGLASGTAEGSLKLGVTSITATPGTAASAASFFTNSASGVKDAGTQVNLNSTSTALYRTGASTPSKMTLEFSGDATYTFSLTSLDGTTQNTTAISAAVVGGSVASVVAAINNQTSANGIVASLDPNNSKALILERGDGKKIQLTGFTSTGDATVLATPSAGQGASIRLSDDSNSVQASATSAGAAVATVSTMTFSAAADKVSFKITDGRSTAIVRATDTGGAGAAQGDALLTEINSALASAGITDITAAKTVSSGQTVITFTNAKGGSVDISQFVSDGSGTATFAPKTGQGNAVILDDNGGISASGKSIKDLSIATEAGGTEALAIIDNALQQVNDERSKLGALQNRLEFTVNNLTNIVTNTAAAKSRIMDTDYATETTTLARSQIITQAATAMLAQANQSSQSVLALLK